MHCRRNDVPAKLGANASASCTIALRLFVVAQLPQAGCTTRRFFYAAADFQKELALYQEPDFLDVLPDALLARANDDGAIRSASGAAAPPFLVLERGMVRGACLL